MRICLSHRVFWLSTKLFKCCEWIWYRRLRHSEWSCNNHLILCYVCDWRWRNTCEYFAFLSRFLIITTKCAITFKRLWSLKSKQSFEVKIFISLLTRFWALPQTACKWRPSEISGFWKSWRWARIALKARLRTWLNFLISLTSISHTIISHASGILALPSKHCNSSVLGVE